jgi:geranylgeranyl pyrophosphate synthase
LSVDFYFDMIGRKTAALIAASVQAGALLASDDEAVIDAYRGFGWALGMAFQLNDDLLGIWGDEQSTGKEPSDLAKHKKTLPLIYALEKPDLPTAAVCASCWRRRTDGERAGRGARHPRAQAARASTRATRRTSSVTRQ